MAVVIGSVIYILETKIYKHKCILLKKKVLHHIVLSNFKVTFLSKITKAIFQILYCRRELDSVSGTTINFCGNITLKSVKMHFSGHTEILGFKKSTFFQWVQNSFC